jgi:UDP-N-acetylmuramyl tripeptide synthase
VKHAAAHGAAANHAKVDLSHMNKKFAAKPGRGQFNFELPKRGRWMVINVLVAGAVALQSTISIAAAMR